MKRQNAGQKAFNVKRARQGQNAWRTPRHARAGVAASRAGDLIERQRCQAQYFLARGPQRSFSMARVMQALGDSWQRDPPARPSHPSPFIGGGDRPGIGRGFLGGFNPMGG